MKKALTALAVQAVLLIGLAATAAALAPQTINYQAMLTDDADQPLADQTVTMIFTIYDADSAGTALWTETQSPTTNSIGVVSVLLGDVNPIDIDFDSPLWLEVEVNGEPLSPRREVAGAPYAITDETSGGDGHSLDASDGDPINALYVDSQGEVGIGFLNPQATLHVNGEVLLQSTTGNAYVSVTTGDPGVEKAVLYASEAHGGFSSFKNASGEIVASLGASFAHSGGYLSIYRDDIGSSGSGINLSGNYQGLGEPRIEMEGSRGSMVFDLNESLNNSVQLPAGAIDAGEIWNEPGIQSGQSATEVALTGGGAYNQVNHGEIYVPGGGYVLAIATAQVNFYHDGAASSAWFGISETNTGFSDQAQEINVTLSGGVPAGSYSLPLTLNAVFQVDVGGNETLYFMASEGLGEWTVSSRQLTLLYIPSAYGTIDVDDEPARELEELRARIDELEKKMSNTEE